jgi:thiosulfate/3-mercaptopyruvate sulfurtransferase
VQTCWSPLEWAEQNLDTPGVVFAEVDEDTTAYDSGPHPGRREARLEERAAGPGRRDFVDRRGLRGSCCPPRASANDDTVILYGGNNNWFAAYAYWYFKLYGHKNVQAARRRPQEVGARRPAS